MARMVLLLLRLLLLFVRLLDTPSVLRLRPPKAFARVRREQRDSKPEAEQQLDSESKAAQFKVRKTEAALAPN